MEETTTPIIYTQHWEADCDMPLPWHRAIAVLGKSTAIMDYPGREPDAAYVYGLYVAKDERLKGYGTALLDALEDRAKGKAKRVIIDYCPKSTPMWVLAWYMRRGYKITYNSKEKKILTKTL